MSFHVGEDIGDYRVVSILGAGSMGQVFLVEHQITKRKEAAKVLLADIADDRQIQRFMREIEIQARLDHPNIARVHNAFHLKDCLILIMEFVEGESLEKLIRKGSLEMHVGIGYIRQMLSALHYAHARGVVHRDITPGNLIIGPDGNAILTDFGLAKSLGDYQLTNGGEIVGSLHYMAPEQLRSRAVPDPRSDIYSTGAVLYEILTGRKLFECNDRLSLMVAQVRKQPVAPLDIRPEIGRQLSDVVLTAMAKDPAQRFQSAEEFLDALDRATCGSELSGHTAKTAAPAELAFLGRIGAVALTACLIAATGDWGRGSALPAVPSAPPAKITTAAPPAASPINIAAAPLPRPFHHAPRSTRPKPAAVQQSIVAQQSIPAPSATVSKTLPESQQPSVAPTVAPTKKRFWSKLNPFHHHKRPDQVATTARTAAHADSNSTRSEP